MSPLIRDVFVSPGPTGTGARAKKRPGSSSKMNENPGPMARADRAGDRLEPASIDLGNIHAGCLPVRPDGAGSIVAGHSVLGAVSGRADGQEPKGPRCRFRQAIDRSRVAKESTKAHM
jgi:hypothetical protein